MTAALTHNGAMNGWSRALLAAMALSSLACGDASRNKSVYSEKNGTLVAVGESAIPEFWDWFKTNSPRIERELYELPDKTVNEVSAQVQRINSVLAVELGLAEDNVYELIISADGMREAVPWVEKTVAAAPSIEGWRVIAFRPKKPGSETVEYKGVTLRSSDVHFVIVDPTPPVAIDFYIEGLKSDRDLKAHVLFLLLDSVIGEYNVMTKLGGIQILPMSQRPATAKPLRDLPAALGL
jgi:hypothetical protein